MALIDSAVNGLAGALISGGVATVTFWLSGRARNRRMEEAWRKQANELTDELSKQYQGEISRLRAHYSNEVEYLRSENEECRNENKRLNKLLNQQRRGGTP